MKSQRRNFPRQGGIHLLALVAAAGSLSACSGAGGAADSPGELSALVGPPATEDGLADAFANFQQQFQAMNFHHQYPIGAGYHPGLSTEKATDANGKPAGCKITIDRDLQKITARLEGIPENQNYDLWFVKNATGAGTAKPETGDTFQFIDTFGAMVGAARTIDKLVGNIVFFDLDMVVVTRAGQHPTANRVLVGGRTLFEKRYFRAVDHASMETVSGPLDNTVETTIRSCSGAPSSSTATPSAATDACARRVIPWATTSPSTRSSSPHGRRAIRSSCSSASQRSRSSRTARSCGRALSSARTWTALRNLPSRAAPTTRSRSARRTTSAPSVPRFQ